MRWSAAVFACLGATALFPDSAAAQERLAVPEPDAGQLARQLTRHEESLAEQGYRSINGPYTGALGEGEAQRYNFLLRAGFRYSVVAVCDNDCRDIDLRLLDQNGYVINEDELDGRAAEATSQPRWTGAFAIEVQMVECRNAICYFALNIYGQ